MRRALPALFFALALLAPPAHAQVGSLRGRSLLLGNNPLVCQVSTASLPGGSINVAYSQTLATTNCTAPVTWAITVGSLCPGLALNSSTGVVSGTVPLSQVCSFTVQATDATTATATANLSITIAANGSLSGGNALQGGAAKR